MRSHDVIDIEPTRSAREIVPRAESAGAVTPMHMLNQAVAQGANVDVLEKLMGLAERWERNQARKAFEAAITAAKAALPAITRNKAVDFTGNTGKRTNYRHETLDHVVETIRPVLEAHGLSFRFRTDVRDDGKVVVTCRIAHRDGYSEETSLPGPADVSGNKNAIQAIGSTVTYLQRYTLKAALGLAVSDDDDGHGSGGNGGGDAISDEQARHLFDLLNETGADTARFCRFFRIPAVAALPAGRFDEATRMLNAKRRQA